MTRLGAVVHAMHSRARRTKAKDAGLQFPRHGHSGLCATQRSSRYFTSKSRVACTHDMDVVVPSTAKRALMQRSSRTGGTDRTGQLRREPDAQLRRAALAHQRVHGTVVPAVPCALLRHEGGRLREPRPHTKRPHTQHKVITVPRPAAATSLLPSCHGTHATEHTQNQHCMSNITQKPSVAEIGQPAAIGDSSAPCKACALRAGAAELSGLGHSALPCAWDLYYCYTRPARGRLTHVRPPPRLSRRLRAIFGVGGVHWVGVAWRFCTSSLR
jgi:hypothetical protein